MLERCSTRDSHSAYNFFVEAQSKGSFKGPEGIIIGEASASTTRVATSRIVSQSQLKGSQKSLPLTSNVGTNKVR